MASYLDLSIKERIILLKTWILAVLLLTARVYVAERATSAAFTNIHNVLFSFDSQRVTLHELSQTREHGGHALPLANSCLMAHAGLPSMAHLFESYIFPPVLVQHFYRCCSAVSFAMKPHGIPLLQLGSMRKPWKPNVSSLQYPGFL